MPCGHSDDKSTFVQVMACCLTARSQCWPTSMSTYGVGLEISIKIHLYKFFKMVYLFLTLILTLNPGNPRGVNSKRSSGALKSTEYLVNFMGLGRHSKCNCLQDRANFHKSRAWQIVPILNTAHVNRQQTTTWTKADLLSIGPLVIHTSVKSESQYITFCHRHRRWL